MQWNSIYLKKRQWKHRGKNQGENLNCFLDQFFSEVSVFTSVDCTCTVHCKKYFLENYENRYYTFLKIPNCHIVTCAEVSLNHGSTESSEHLTSTDLFIWISRENWRYFSDDFRLSISEPGVLYSNDFKINTEEGNLTQVYLMNI